jgi:phosphoglycerate dehydrogenase-like enzyme
MTTESTPPSGPVVVVTEHLHADALGRLGEAAVVLRVDPDDPGALHAALARADALVVRTYTTVDAGLLARAPRLRVVGRAGVGLDAIDVAACRARGVEVVHTPDANSLAVVGWVMAVLLPHLRPLPRVPATGADGPAWRALREAALVARSIDAMTVGVLGLGRVGTRVANAFSALGARVLAHDLRAIDVADAAACGATIVTAEQLHAESDVLTLHVDGREANRGLYDRTRLEALREDVVLLNASRGLVIDAAALAAFLDARPQATAILDVHDPEPVPPGHPLLGHPRAILTPHVASRTEAAQRAMSDVVDDVLAVLAGAPPRFPAPALAPAPAPAPAPAGDEPVSG